MAGTQVPVQPSSEQPSGSAGPPVWLRVVLLVVVLGGFLAGMNWLIHSAPGPTASRTPVPTAASTSAPAPAARPTVVPTTIPTPRPTVAPTATAAPTVTPAPTNAPTVQPALSAILATDWWNWSTGNISDERRSEVTAAVDAYWTALGQTWQDLDPQHLAAATTEPRLGELHAIVVQDREAGRSVDPDIQRTDLVVHYVDENSAVAYETYVDRSVAIDFATRNPLEPTTPVSRQSSYLLWRDGGTLKVAQVAHHENEPSQ